VNGSGRADPIRPEGARRQWLRRAGRALLGLASFERVTLIATSIGMATHASGQPTPSLQEQQIELDRAINRILSLKDVKIREGRVTVEVPALADNGNSVACVISVDSPMTEADHVRAVHLFLARNPRPFALSAYLTPRSVRARIETRIRLAGSQRVYALAQMSDGSCWSGGVDVTVTVSACVDGS
jgi:sulfur-oxidizing protein SoxY